MIMYICAILPWAFLIVWSSWPWLLRFPDVFTKFWSSVVSSVNSWSTVPLLSPRGNSLTYSLLQRLESNVYECFTCCQEQYPLSGIIPGPIYFSLTIDKNLYQISVSDIWQYFGKFSHRWWRKDKITNVNYHDWVLFSETETDIDCIWMFRHTVNSIRL